MKLPFKKQNQPEPIPNKKVRKNVFSYKYIYIIVYLTGIGALAYIGYFIYENYYQTITQAQQIVDLRKEVAPDSIDINKVNQVLEAIAEKSTSTEATIPSDIKNPFDPFPTNNQPDQEVQEKTVETPATTTPQ